VAETRIWEGQIDSGPVVESNVIVEARLPCSAAAVLDVLPGDVKTVDAFGMEASKQENVLGTHTAGNVQQAAIPCNSAKRREMPDQIFRCGDVVGYTFFPKAEIQVAVVEVDVALRPGAIEALHFALLSCSLPLETVFGH
jgi:hypothetical protein